MFRTVFLYMPKIILAIWAIVFIVTDTLYGFSRGVDVLTYVALATVIGALFVGLYLFAIRKTMACPICSVRSPLQIEGEWIGVTCSGCGYVFVRSPFSCKLSVLPPSVEDSTPDDS